MKLTAGKLRYLMTVDGLQGSLPKVRCIDVAEQLPDKSLHITPLGCQMTEQYAQQYQKLYPVFHQMGLSEFDAQECVMALLSQLSEQTLKNVCACFTPQASSLSA